MNRVCRLIVSAALLLVATLQSSASHLDLRIFCIEPTPKPKCCEAVSDSGGAPPITYEWWADWGEFVFVATSWNYNDYHCGSIQTHTANLNNWVDEGVLLGHGTFTC